MGLKNDGALTNLLLLLLAEEGHLAEEAGVTLVCLSYLCSLSRLRKAEGLLLPRLSAPPLPPKNEGKAGTFLSQGDTFFCLCDREGIYFF